MIGQSQEPPVFGLLVIPAFRESARLPRFLDSLRRKRVIGRPGWVVRVVDDGSGCDGLRELRGAITGLGMDLDDRLELLELPKNLGKGAAVYAGWHDDACLRTLGFVDADGAIPASEVLRLMKEAEAKPNVALFGARVKMLGRSVERSWQRHLMGRFFAWLVGSWVNPLVYDSQCGCKFIPAKAYRNVADSLQESGFAFDVELIDALATAGVTMEEIPIDWQDIAGSKVHLVRDSVRMIIAIIRIVARKKRASRGIGEPDRTHQN